MRITIDTPEGTRVLTGERTIIATTKMKNRRIKMDMVINGTGKGAVETIETIRALAIGCTEKSKNKVEKACIINAAANELIKDAEEILEEAKTEMTDEEIKRDIGESMCNLFKSIKAIEE